MGSNHAKKTGGRKSRDTLPLRTKNIWNSRKITFNTFFEWDSELYVWMATALSKTNKEYQNIYIEEEVQN